MKNKSTNSAQQLGKKIFIAGKIYDLQTMDKDEVEASVQEYLDSHLTGMHIDIKNESLAAGVLRDLPHATTYLQ